MRSPPPVAARARARPSDGACLKRIVTGDEEDSIGLPDGHAVLAPREVGHPAVDELERLRVEAGQRPCHVVADRHGTIGRDQLDVEPFAPLGPHPAALARERDQPRVVVRMPEDPRLAGGLAAAG